MENRLESWDLMKSVSQLPIASMDSLLRSVKVASVALNVVWSWAECKTTQTLHRQPPAHCVSTNGSLVSSISGTSCLKDSSERLSQMLPDDGSILTVCGYTRMPYCRAVRTAVRGFISLPQMVYNGDIAFIVVCHHTVGLTECLLTFLFCKAWLLLR